MDIMANYMQIATAVFLAAAGPAFGCGKFEGRLILEDVAHLYERDIDDDVGHTEFKLLSPYTYVDCQSNSHLVPPYRIVNGQKVPTIINGASIPPQVWSFVGGPWSGKYRNAAVIHDYLVEIRYSSSDVTHRIFYDAMLTSGTPKWKASLMYFAVLKGGSTWEEGSGYTSERKDRDLSIEDLQNAEAMFRSKELSPEEIKALAQE